MIVWITQTSRKSSKCICRWIPFKKVGIPDCDICKQNLTSAEPTSSHVFVSHKERGEEVQCLTYPSDRVTQLIETIHEKIFG